MNTTLFKTDTASEFITKALNDFLRDKNLTLTDQQYVRLKKLLMVRLLDDEMSYECAYNQLCEIKEHRKDYEIDINAQNEAEEEMIRIIGTADITQVEVSIEGSHYKNRFIIALGLLILACISLVFLTFSTHINHKTIERLTMSQTINIVEENNIKMLVQEIITLETKAGNKVNHSAIYKEIKDLSAIQSLGEARSYKKFNKAQYEVAIKYLNGRVTGLNNQ